MACLSESTCEREMKEGLGDGGNIEYERNIARAKFDSGEDIWVEVSEAEDTVSTYECESLVVVALRRI